MQRKRGINCNSIKQKSSFSVEWILSEITDISVGFWHSQSYSFKGLGNNDLTAKTRPKRSREQNYTP